MTPEEIKAWAQQHGGDAGADPPDANGITVYRAADGSFINVRADGSLAMRGRGTPQSPAAADAPAAPPAAPRGGGAMQQQDVEQWIAQQGGQGRVQYTRATKQVDNPAADIDKAKAAGVPFQVGAPEKISVSEEKWSAVDAAGKDTGAVLHVSRRPDGSFDIVNQSNANPTARPAGAASTEPPKTEDRGGRHYVWQPNPPDQGGGQWVDTGPAPQTAAERAAADANKPQLVPGTLNTTSPRMGVWDPATQTVTWAPNENYQNPSPKPITLPNTRTIFWDDGNGTIRQEKNTAYVKPSKLVPNPSDPRKWVNITEDDNGNPVILPVDDKTTITPADLPVLQAKFGEISQGLGQLAKDLNSRVNRQEITPEERKTAFEAAHAQASTQVAEINSILENSKAIWSGQVTQRGQSLAETQSRRSFADSMANRAMQTGASVAAHSGKGSGAAIAGGVEALMRMGQRYAEGMGGFKESPEIGLPPALQQAQGISLPGYGPNAGAPPSPPPPPSGANVDAANASVSAGSRAAFGGLGMPPAGGPSAGPSGGPLLPPPPPVPGQSPVGGPPMAGMNAALQGAAGYAGEPVAAGGTGVWNPDAAVQGMLGDGSDPAWAEAVRRAAQEHGQVGR